jgi:DNA-binding transcriptional LysR family regulator
MQQLRYFLVVARELNYTRAAEQLYITQQALSETVRKLEAEYDVKLFELCGRRLVLTDAGKALAESAHSMLRTESDLSGKLTDIKQNRAGVFSFGFTTSRAEVLALEAITHFNKLYPNMKIKTEEQTLRVLEQELLKGNLDIILGFGPFESSAIQCVPIHKERLFVLATERLLRGVWGEDYESTYERMKKGAKLSEFIQLPFLMPQSFTRLRQALDYLLAKEKLQPQILFEGNIGDLRGQLAEKSMGITFLSELSIKIFKIKLGNHSGRDSLHAFPITDPKAFVEFSAAYHRERYFSQSSKDFVSIIRESCGRIVAEPI